MDLLSGGPVHCRLPGVAEPRKDILSQPLRGTLWALAPILFALLLYWMGYKANTRYLGFASAQLMVAGLILWFGGFRVFRILFFAWIFLGFMWPMQPLEDVITVPLRHITAAFSAGFLNLVGLETLKEGTSLVSAPVDGLARGERFSLDVEAPCSGIRSLFALMMISAIYGYLVLPKLWQRMLLFLGAVPLAMMGNFVRILMLTFGSMLWGSEFAIGSNDSPSSYHMNSGFAVYAAGLAGMFALATLLERFGKKKKRKGKSRTQVKSITREATGKATKAAGTKPSTRWWRSSRSRRMRGSMKLRRLGGSRRTWKWTGPGPRPSSGCRRGAGLLR